MTSEDEWRKIIRRNKSIGLNCADYRWGSLAYDDTKASSERALLSGVGDPIGKGWK